MKYVSEKREVRCGVGIIEYLLTRKPVKNINLRIKPNGKIYVSANHKVSADYIDNFIREKQVYIIRTQKSFKENHKEFFEEICREVYEVFRKYGVKYPTIKIRYMTSRWGSCRPQKGNITLNSRLIDAPRSCIEYVVYHEFAHLIHPNHSKKFYDFLTMLMPDWRDRKEELNKVL